MYKEVIASYKNYISLVCSVYNSHKVFAEQLHFLSNELKGLGRVVEVIFVDDGSEPPLTNIYNIHSERISDTLLFKNFKLLYTHSKVIWNQPAGRNLGVKKANGNYLLLFDLDHIMTRDMVIELLNFSDDMMRWPRMYGILNEGKIVTDIDILRENGLKPNVETNKLMGVCNIFAISKAIYDELGGYDEKFCGKYSGDDIDFLKRFGRRGGTYRRGTAYMYVYPNGRKHPDLHDLHRQHDIEKKPSEMVRKA